MPLALQGLQCPVTASSGRVAPEHIPVVLLRYIIIAVAETSFQHINALLLPTTRTIFG
jgi:hypothetical protein